MFEMRKGEMPIAWTLRNPEDAKHFTWWDYARITKKKAVFRIGLKKLQRLSKLFRSS